MEYVSSCQAIELWENLCISGVKHGYAEEVHNGKVSADAGFYTKVYHINVKSSLYPVVIKFWYDKRNKEGYRKDVAAVKISLNHLILLLEAVSSRQFDIKMQDMEISMGKDGLRIEHTQ